MNKAKAVIALEANGATGVSLGRWASKQDQVHTTTLLYYYTTPLLFYRGISLGRWASKQD